MKVLVKGVIVWLAVLCAWFLPDRIAAWLQSRLARQVTVDDLMFCKACGRQIVIDTQMEHKRFCKGESQNLQREYPRIPGDRAASGSSLSGVRSTKAAVRCPPTHT